MKKKFKYLVLMIESFVFLLFRRLLGNRIQAAPTTFVSRKASLITNLGKGIICIGRRTAVRANTEIHADGGKIIIGQNCFVNKNCMIVSHDSIQICDGVTIGPNVCIYDHDHDGCGGYCTAPIVIGENTWIGAGCILLKGVSLGKNCVVGAGCVITRNVPDNVFMYQKRNSTYVMRKL